MKKMLLMLGVAAAAMTSCTNDEVVEVNPTATIQFETFVNKGTRATSDVTVPTIEDGILKSGLGNFFVYGFYGTTDVFTGNEVAWVDKDGTNGNRWTYNEGVHTNWTGGDYYFAAYANKNKTKSGDAITKATQITDVTFDKGTKTLSIPSYTVTDAEDLVAAWYHHDNEELTNPTVALDFKHMLSKVYFEITNAASEDLRMELSDIVINVAPSGTCAYDGTNITWQYLAGASQLNFAGTGTYDNSNPSTYVVKNVNHETTDHFVIPGQTGITASFTAKFRNSAGTEIDAVPYTNVRLDVSGGWKAGYVYKYTASIGATMPTIEFGVSVTEWDSDLNNNDQEDDDITLR